MGRHILPRFARASLRNPERIFKKNLGENLTIPSPLPPTAFKCIYSPLEGVRGVELVTYSDVINIGLPIGEGRVRSWALGFTDRHARLRLRLLRQQGFQR